MYTTWLIDMCYMTLSRALHVHRTVSTCTYFLHRCTCVTWLVNHVFATCIEEFSAAPTVYNDALVGMTHRKMWHDPSIRMTWLIHMCDMTHRYVWHDSSTWVTWLIHMCDMTHPHVWHDSSMCDVTHPHVWHDSSICVTHAQENYHLHLLFTTMHQHKDINLFNSFSPPQYLEMRRYYIYVYLNVHICKYL